jgi:hypothetical protein
VVTVTVTIKRDAAGTDSHVGLGQRDIAGSGESAGGGRQSREAERRRKYQSKGFH